MPSHRSQGAGNKFRPGASLACCVSLLFLAVGLSSLGAIGAQPVILHLRGGDRLTGAITAEDTHRVAVLTQRSKEAVVPLPEILKRQPLPVPLDAKSSDALPAPPVAWT